MSTFYLYKIFSQNNWKWMILITKKFFLGFLQLSTLIYIIQKKCIEPKLSRIWFSTTFVRTIFSKSVVQMLTALTYGIFFSFFLQLSTLIYIFQKIVLYESFLKFHSAQLSFEPFFEIPKFQSFSKDALQFPSK